MVSPDGGTVLVFNGEVYNHLELRRELEGLGHRFRSQSDTETVLHAFLQWDTDSFSRLRGMFAAGFWVESEHRLVLVRDRMGIKPLYIAERQGDLYFGSEIKAILQHPEFERKLSGAGLHRFLSLNYVPGPDTLVEGIRKLPPGTWMEWRRGRTTSAAYWSIGFQPDSRITLDSAKEELDGLLRDAVREQLVADVPVGAWSSGGLDSSTLVHYACERASGRLKTFSISFHGRSFDESRYFQEVSNHYGTDHYEMDVNPACGIADAMEELVHYSDEPSADAGALPVWFLSRMTAQSVTVALSGEGSDELFGGYKTYVADAYARRLRMLPGGLLRLAGKAASLLPVSDEKIGLDYKVNRMLQGSTLPPMEAHMFWNGTFSAASRCRLMDRSSSLFDSAAPMEMPGEAGSLNRFLWLDQMYYLPDDILNKSDRMSMAHSLEVRPPFLDHRIVEFASRLPEDFKIRGGKLKFVLRELMRGKLPAPVVRRSKEGFDIPAHDWLRTVLRPLLLDTLNERSVRESGFLHWPAVQAVLRAHMERRANLGYHLWGLLVLFLWMRHWGIAPPSQTRRSDEIAAAVSVAGSSYWR
jgi:asparagine synthase (glutamine-hydrolysing)